MQFARLFDRPLAVAGAALFIALALFTIRAAILNSPLIAGDEYGYFVLAQYFPRVDIPIRLDPLLSQVGVQAYLALGHRWFLAGPDHAALLGRLWNSAVYVLASIPLGLALWRVFDSKVAMLTCVAYLALPMSLYSATLMAEADYVFVFYALLCAYIWLWPARPFVFAGVGGVLLGIAFLIKPHALSLLAATIAAIVVSRAVRATAISWPRLALCAAAICATAYGTGVLLIWLLTGRLLLTIAELVGTFYFGVAGGGFDVSYWLKNIAGIAKYAIAHGVVMLFLVPFGVIGIVLAAIGRPDVGHGAAAASMHRTFALFAGSAIVMVIAMVAVFTHAVGEASSFEAERLQGRMVNFLLPLLVAEAIFLTKQPSKRWFRSVAIAWAIAGAAILFWIVPQFKIYPWDNAELFALFRHPNHYSWNWTWRGTALGEYIAWIVFGAAIVAVWRADAAPRLAMAAFAAFVVIAQLQSNAWAYSQSSTTVREYGDAASSVKTLVGAGAGSEGKGLVVGSDRYVRMSMVLFHLGPAQYVKQLPVGQAITAADIPVGVDWMVLVDRYPVAVPYAKSMRVGPLELYTFRNTRPYVFEREKEHWAGEPLSVRFADTGDVGSLYGFNDPEPWGSWSAQSDAYAMLPALIDGQVTLKMFAWTVAPNIARKLKLRIGGTMQEIQLTEKPMWHELSLDVKGPADRVSFTYEPYRETPWARPVGVAVAEIQIVRYK